MNRNFVLLGTLLLIVVSPPTFSEQKTATKYRAWCVKVDKSEPYFGLKLFCESNGGVIFNTRAEALSYVLTQGGKKSTDTKKTDEKQKYRCGYFICGEPIIKPYPRQGEKIIELETGEQVLSIGREGLVKFSEAALNEYLDACSQKQYCGLSMTRHGHYGFIASDKYLLREHMLEPCERSTPYPDLCKIVDRNGKSQFISDFKSGLIQDGDKPPSIDGNYRLVSTGTGFVVNESFVVTANHVLSTEQYGDCNRITVGLKGKSHHASPVAGNQDTDLGLIKLTQPISLTSAKLRGGPALRLGETVSTYGFPLMGTLSNTAKVTSGAINSLAGLKNNSAFIQYSAPTQPGNSGGPLLDASANVVGIVSSGLSKRYADETGHIAQNVNFATKSTILEGFLKANKVPFEKADLEEELKLPDIAEKAETFTVLVGCWQ